MSDKGTYGGFTVGFPTPLGGVGFGAYMDNSGRLYPQLYYGTPRFGASAGYTNDLGALLTGPSAAGSIGRGWIGANVATVGSETGVGFGTPGVGVTYGFGPLDFSQDYSQPWIKGLIRDSVDGAGLPSPRNVWEYGYPEPEGGRNAEAGPVPRGDIRRLTRVNASSTGAAPVSGSAPAAYPSAAFNDRFGDWGGPPGEPQPSQASGPIGVFANEPNSAMASSMRGFDARSDAMSATGGSVGGLLGMIQDYMRNNAY
ncbi:hypothetical protein [Bradyrhizobium sp. 930_D9_N1_4]|uniref:hypothetical protein n=1 Tax=Bradyrhizobium sp. 930_D9_N1_4 TaxID=3240374 RepID=UPI003F8B15BE